jgi:hypothetical protein
MTTIVFVCPSCKELIYHGVDVELDPPKFRAPEVPVTLAYMVDGNEIQCDRCARTFIAECVRVPQTTEVLLTGPATPKSLDDDLLNQDTYYD